MALVKCLCCSVIQFNFFFISFEKNFFDCKINWSEPKELAKLNSHDEFDEFPEREMFNEKSPISHTYLASSANNFFDLVPVEEEDVIERGSQAPAVISEGIELKKYLKIIYIKNTN